MKYHVQISGVREVSLLGNADLGFWQEYLSPHDLVPSNQSNHARLLICAVAAKFNGIPFKELSLSVFVSSDPDGTRQDGVFLLHAFNSLRLFAFCERVLFSTPYYFARLQVEAGAPAHFRTEASGKMLLHAAMDDGIRKPVRAGEEGWKGPLFLPTPAPGKLFFGDLHGFTEVYPYEPLRDQFALQPAVACPVIQQLLDSRFSPEEWSLRKAAIHCKSKTVRRDRVDGFAGIDAA